MRKDRLYQMIKIGMLRAPGLLLFFTGQSTAGWVGVLANFLTGAALVVSAGAVQRLAERAGRSTWLWSTPFNLVKGAISCSVSLAFYRRLQPFFASKVAAKAA